MVWTGRGDSTLPVSELFLLLVAVDMLVLMAERGCRYGLDLLPFNVAHFGWLDALHRVLMPPPAPDDPGVPSATYYICILSITSFLAFVLFLVGHRPVLTAIVTLLYTYAWSMSRLDSYLHHYMITLILGCIIFFPKIDASSLYDWATSDSSHADTPANRTDAKQRRRGWWFAITALSLAIAYRISLSRAVDLDGWQRWASMFVCFGVLATLVIRQQSGLAAGAGPLISSWAFRLLGTTVGVIYVFTSLAKVDAAWCGGYTLREVGTTASVLKPVEHVASLVGIPAEWFWAVLATLVIPLELTLAASYMLAVRQDRPGRKWLPRWCFVAWLLAIGLHLNNEMMNLVIQWFGYYMLFLATLFLLPARPLLVAGAAIYWPEYWLRRRLQEATSSMSSPQEAMLLAVLTFFALFVLVLGGFYIGLVGSMIAGCLLAAGLVVALIVGIVGGWGKKLLAVSSASAVADCS